MKLHSLRRSDTGVQASIFPNAPLAACIVELGEADRGQAGNLEAMSFRPGGRHILGELRKRPRMTGIVSRGEIGPGQAEEWLPPGAGGSPERSTYERGSSTGRDTQGSLRPDVG